MVSDVDDKDAYKWTPWICDDSNVTVDNGMALTMTMMTMMMTMMMMPQSWWLPRWWGEKSGSFFTSEFLLLLIILTVIKSTRQSTMLYIQFQHGPAQLVDLWVWETGNSACHEVQLPRVKVHYIALHACMDAVNNSPNAETTIPDVMKNDTSLQTLSCKENGNGTSVPALSTW